MGPTPTGTGLGLPAILDWADFIVFGVIVTLYTLIRHLMSRPKATVEFASDPAGGIRMIVYSRSVGRLRRNLIGHRDPLVDLRVLFHVVNADGRTTHETMGAGRLVDMFDATNASTTMTVTRSRPAVFYAGVLRDGEAYVPNVGNRAAPIGAGTYVGLFDISWSENTKSIKREFTVDVSGRMRWVHDGSVNL